ncbi:MAG: LCP family protein, partial [Parcubacteria group bacterium]
NPGWGNKTKINAVYAAGEENGKKQGLQDMKKVVSEVTGLQVEYGASINFAGFKQLIDAIGGIDITLANSFDEAMQFNEPHVCDSSFFTVPTGQFENKTTKYFSNDTKTYKTRITASYPLCTAPKNTLECGGNFKLPAGKQTLTGEQALCYVRSRVTSSDFERAKRQQQIIQLAKDKLMSAGTLTDFGKLDAISDSLGDNVRSDMQAWEMKRFYDLYSKMNSPQAYQRVLENSQEGLLYSPQDSGGAGYILLPIGDNYDKIRDVAKNIFTLPAQSDINPK